MTPMNEKIAYAIGDIHGRLDLLLASMSLIEADVKSRGLADEEYLIVTLGDYTDRGPNTKGVIEYLMKHPKITAVAGNHEYILLECFDWNTLKPIPWPQSSRDLASFLRNGGIETLESYGYEHIGSTGANVDMSIVPKEHIQWMLDLPLFFETENYFFVHAGVKPYVRLEEQRPNDLIWIRHEFFMEADAPNPYNWGKHIVHGHTPNYNYRPELKHNRTNLDCGGVWSGRQAVGVFDLTVQRGPIDVLYAEIVDKSQEEELDEYILDLLSPKKVLKNRGLWDFSD